MMHKYQKGQIVYVKGHGATKFIVVGAGAKSCVLDQVVGATPGNRRWADHTVIRKTSRNT